MEDMFTHIRIPELYLRTISINDGMRAQWYIYQVPLINHLEYFMTRPYGYGHGGIPKAKACLADSISSRRAGSLVPPIILIHMADD